MLVLPSGAPSTGGFSLTRSLRFRRSAAARLSRTPSSASNRRTWTWSAWVKRGSNEASTVYTLFSAKTGPSDYTVLRLLDDALEFQSTISGTTVTFSPTAKYRDFSAFYHVMVSVDTTLATAADRFIVYVNGVRPAYTGGTPVAQNAQLSVNANDLHEIGDFTLLSLRAFDGVLAEVNFVDGQALTPSSFGEIDATTGVWKPKKYTGSYGTNGFYLPFTDNGALTTASNVGLGRDYSGNGNYWVTNNISITAGATYDSFTDVPTLTSSTAANYCVLNPLHKGYDAGTQSLTDGNLRFAADGTISNYRVFYGTIQPPSGSYYFEVTVHSTGGFDTSSQGIYFAGQKYAQNGTKLGGGAYGSSLTASTVAGCVVTPTGTWVHLNGTWQGGATLADINNGVLTNSMGAPVFPMEVLIGDWSATTGSFMDMSVNFGQQPWAYPAQVPSACVPINTFNLPTPAIVQGNKYFDVVTRTSPGSGQTISSLQFQPDLIWDKTRSTTGENSLIDSSRGVSKSLVANTTSSEATYATFFTAFTSNGFTTGAGDWPNTTTVVDWAWKKGATPGFDIVLYSGNSAGRTISHALGVAPKFMIVKARNDAVDWAVWHASLASPTAGFLALNSNASASSSVSIWNNTLPTSSVFSVGNYPTTNASPFSYVAYLWSEIAGFSRFGTYTGNGSSDGPFVFCGFRPRFVMIKRTSGVGGWYLMDTSRSASNVVDNLLFAETTGATLTSTTLDIVSNGFKIRNTSADYNASGSTHIFAAFAENPFKHALAR